MHTLTRVSMLALVAAVLYGTLLLLSLGGAAVQDGTAVAVKAFWRLSGGNQAMAVVAALAWLLGAGTGALWLLDRGEAEEPEAEAEPTNPPAA